jgi:hypothetical protein
MNLGAFSISLAVGSFVTADPDGNPILFDQHV